MQLNLIRCWFANAIISSTDVGAAFVAIHVFNDQSAGDGAFLA